MITRSSGAPTICLIAADVSGDQNGARLAAALRELRPDVRLIAAGGAALRDAGVDVLVDSGAVSMIGPPGSLHAARALVRVWRALRRIIDAERPDVAVLIDNETFNLLLARRLRRRGVPTAFFFPPQVWFWGRWRTRWIARLGMRLLCAFEPEAELYRQAGADAIWTGHPLRDAVRVTEDAAGALRAIGLDPARPLVLLMPGSRPAEVRFNGPLMAEVARRLQHADPALQFAVPLAATTLRAEVERYLGQSRRDFAIYLPRSYAVLSRARAVLQCAGTATLEAALLGIPAVIVYRCARWQEVVARRLMRVRFIGMPNLLLGEMVQPEFFGARIDPRRLTAEMEALLSDANRRRSIGERLARLPELLGPPGAIRRAAESVLELLPGTSDARWAEPRPHSRAVFRASAMPRQLPAHATEPARPGRAQSRDPG